MTELNFHAKISVCSYDELNTTEKLLVNKAKEVLKDAYAPYSRFQVGAALLLSNGEIITGSNQENIAFPSGICAERTALFYAHSRYPKDSVETMAIAAYTAGEFVQKPITPCGSCRQVMKETEIRFHQPIRLILYGEKECYIIENSGDLIPWAFDGDLSL